MLHDSHVKHMLFILMGRAGSTASLVVLITPDSIFAEAQYEAT